MKPHIKKVNRLWECKSLSTPKIITGFGCTPKESYGSWEANKIFEEKHSKYRALIEEEVNRKWPLFIKGLN